MIIRDITCIIPTKNASSKIISKVSKSWELDVSYLPALSYAVIIICNTSIELQQISGLTLDLLHCPRHAYTYNAAKSFQQHGNRQIINSERNS